MEEKIFRFNLDIKDKEFKTDINLVQLDNTSRLIIKLFDAGEKFEIKEDDKAEVAIAKNDCTFVVLNASAYDNTLSCLLTSNALAIPGWTKCEVRILNTDKVLTSASFKVYIRSNIVNNEAIKSTSEYKALESLIAEAEILKKSLKKGESVIDDVNKIKLNLEEIKESILNKSKELNDNLSIVDTKIKLINENVEKAEIALQNLEENEGDIANLQELLLQLETLKKALANLNSSIADAKSEKISIDKSTELAKSEKINLDGSIEIAKTQHKNLQNKVIESETAESTLNAAYEKGQTQEVALDEKIKKASSIETSLSNTTQKGTELNSALEKINNDTENLIDRANQAETGLGAIVPTGTELNKNLNVTEQKASTTKSEIEKLISQLNLTKDEVKEIIASGNLDKYITDIKLKSELESYIKTLDADKKYATKEDLDSIDVTEQLKDYAKTNKVDTKLNNKVDKVEGKELSTNDYSNEEKEKLAGIAKGANKVTKLSELEEDETHRLVTDTEKEKWNTVSNKVDKVYGKELSTNDYTNTARKKVDAIPSNPKYTDTITTINGKTGAISKADITALGIPGTNTTYPVATQSKNGLLSAADKKRLDNIKEQVALTEAEYNALSTEQQNDGKKVYFIKAE